jgi:hypothetical protein
MTTTSETNDTRRILDMLSQGKITVDEADRLIAALGGPEALPGTHAGEPSASDKAKAKWIRINVRKPANEHRAAKDVNIRVPIAVVKGGMRLGALIATFAGEKAAKRMQARGVDLDLSTIHGDLSKMNGPEFDAFLRTLDDVNIEVDDGKSTVRITCE